MKFKKLIICFVTSIFFINSNVTKSFGTTIDNSPCEESCLNTYHNIYGSAMSDYRTELTLCLDYAADEIFNIWEQYPFGSSIWIVPELIDLILQAMPEAFQCITDADNKWGMLINSAADDLEICVYNCPKN